MHEVLQCTANSSRNTTITSREHINSIFSLSPSDRYTTHTNLCDTHYRILHRHLNPQSYNYKCITCGLSLQRPPLSGFRHSPNPTLVQDHLRKHTDFDGDISPTDKVCDSCYRAQLEIIKVNEHTVPSYSEDSEFSLLVNKHQQSIPPLPFPIKSKDDVIEFATQVTMKCLDNGKFQLIIIAVKRSMTDNQPLILLTPHTLSHKPYIH